MHPALNSRTASSRSCLSEPAPLSSQESKPSLWEASYTLQSLSSPSPSTKHWLCLTDILPLWNISQVLHVAMALFCHLMNHWNFCCSLHTSLLALASLPHPPCMASGVTPSDLATLFPIDLCVCCNCSCPGKEDLGPRMGGRLTLYYVSFYSVCLTMSLYSYFWNIIITKRNIKRISGWTLWLLGDKEWSKRKSQIILKWEAWITGRW